ncbi:MAG: O-antigen ligase family protein, partial [Symbiobacteriaceae bacterium]|nr:O-antigen ligase family protein [Symbiobacteriaceae bacterium]
MSIVRNYLQKVESVYAIVVALIVSIAPFWRGLFFAADQLVFSVFVFLIGIVWFWKLKQTPAMDKLDWAVLALSGMYMLSNLVAQNAYQALCWGLQMAAMAIIYFILSRELTNKLPFTRAILQMMVIFSSLIALNGLLAYTGLVWGLVDAVLSDRLTATFQYPNTAAAFFNTGMILCLMVAEYCEKRWQKAFFSGLYVLQVIAFFLCRSRIAFMQFAVILLGFFLLAPWKNKANIAIVGGANLVLGMFATNRLQELFRLATDAGEIWRQGVGMPLGIRLNISAISMQGLAWSLGSCLAGALLYYLLLPVLNRLGSHTPSRQTQRKATYAILAVTVITGLLIVSSLFVPAISGAMRTILGPFLPADLINAITNISAGDVNFTGRIMFIQNAIQIGVNYPFLGTGGGGYASVYSRFQPIFSTSRFTHSQPFQVLSETGFPGFIAYIAIWVFGSWLAIRILLKSFFAEEDDPRRLLMGGLLAAVWSIGAHSTFDFDLTYVGMQMWVYALFAIIAAIAWSKPEEAAVQPTVEAAATRAGSGATQRTGTGAGSGAAQRAGYGSARNPSAKRFGTSSPLLAYIVPIFLCILLCFNIPMVIHEKITEQVIRHTEYARIFETYESALRWINYNSKVLADYAKQRIDLFTRLDDVDEMRTHLIRATQLSNEAVANDPLNPDMLFYQQLCWYYASDWGNGIDGALKLVEASPFWHAGYDLAARSINSGFLNLTERNQFTQLRELARKVASWQQMVEDPLHSPGFRESANFSPA